MTFKFHALAAASFMGRLLRRALRPTLQQPQRPAYGLLVDGLGAGR
ncbi:hypothetical protein [Pelomonas aquatica]|nr:hypothetical protein [Pelomonas aquatica]MCY4753293.1 hypothetical protein [Pelomonas aquatica]